MTNKITPAGSATGIDLSALEQLAQSGKPVGLSAASLLALIALARATPQHPAAPAVGACDLPKLPQPFGTMDVYADDGSVTSRDGYTADQMRGYALDAATPQHSVTEQADDELLQLLIESQDSIGGDWRARRDAAVEKARAQPLASTAATQPEQASELEMFKEWLAKRDPRTFQPDAYWDHGYKWSAWQARAALAIPASTAPTLIQALETGDERESPSWFDIKASAVQSYTEEGYKVRKLYERADSIPASTAASEQMGDKWHSLTCDGTCKPLCAAASEQQSGKWITCPRCKGQHGGVGADGVENDCAKCENGMVLVPAASEQQAGADERAQNILESCARWLAGHAKTTWARDFEHTGLMNRYADRLLEIRAALTHHATTAPGYKLAPLQPTPEMIEAAQKYFATCADYMIKATPVGYYRAMLAAVPDIATTAADQQTERKVKQVIEGRADIGMKIAGYVLQATSGSACIVHLGAVRWLSNAELWNVVHPTADQQGAAQTSAKSAETRMDTDSQPLLASIDGAAQAQAGALYTCKGKGGEYALIGVVYGAGTSRGTTVNLYLETATGVMYYRTPADFADRMERIDRAAMAAPATSGGGNG